MARAKTKEPEPTAATKPAAPPPAPTMAPKIVVFHITGISPLLQNNPAAFIGKTESDAITVKKTYNDEEEARLRLYKNDAGNFCHPSEAFIKAAVAAARGKKFGKVFAAKAIMGSVFMAEPFSIIEDEDGKPAKSYTIDRKPVVVGKARVLRCRPSFFPWRIKVALDINTTMIRPEQVLEVLQLAGYTVGVGDYRPEKGGGFGRFTAELAE